MVLKGEANVWPMEQVGPYLCRQQGHYFGQKNPGWMAVRTGKFN